MRSFANTLLLPLTRGKDGKQAHWWGWLEHDPGVEQADESVRLMCLLYAVLALPYLFWFYKEPVLLGLQGLYVGVNLVAAFGLRGRGALSRFIVAYLTPLLFWIGIVITYSPGEGLVQAKVMFIAYALTPLIVFRMDQRRVLFLAFLHTVVLLATLEWGVAVFPVKILSLTSDAAMVEMLILLEAMVVILVSVWSYKQAALAKEVEIRALLEALTENAGALQHINLELRAKETQLLEMDKTKNKFFTMIAHDLRGPINSFDGFSRLLSEHTEQLSKEEIREMTLTMRRSFDQVKALLENLLSWSRAQMDLIEARPVQVDVPALLENVRLVHAPQAEAKHIALRLSIAPEGPLEWLVDPDLLATILRNLASNAIKFTQEGGQVHISANQEASGLRFCVRDTGVGMGPEEVASLFKVEQRTSRPGTRNEWGTGFGMVLCQEFLQLMGSKLHVRTAEGKGSEFWFVLER